MTRIIQIIQYIYRLIAKKIKVLLRDFILYIVSPKDDLVSKVYYIFIASKYGTPYTLNKNELDVNWFIPAFNPGSGSGGHLNIFRMVHFLEKYRIKNNLVIVESNHLTKKQSKKIINEDYIPVQAELYEGRSEAKPALISMATEWRTAYPVRDFIGSPIKTYFVQDYEPLF
ncbi:MAG TPA: hypothetical protein PLF66_24730, partial [Leptospiraceae bacterium]|nr:hypothetical protein [Leptospiraceae bacterium]